MKSTKKLFAILTLVVFMMTLLPMTALAAAITVIAFPQSGAAVGTSVAASTNIATFTPVTNTAAGMKINVTFPTGTTLTSANIVAADFDITQVGGAATAPTAVSVSGTSIEFTVAAGSVAGDKAGVTIATSATAGGNEITWPVTATTTGTLAVSTDAAADGTYEDTGSIATCVFVVGGANRYSTIVDQDKTSQTADGASLVKFTVYGYDQYNNSIVAPVVAVYPSRGSVDVLAPQTGTTNAGGLDGDGATIFTGSAGVAKFTVSTTIIGTSNIYIGYGNIANLKAYYQDETQAKADTALFIAKKTITWTADAIGSSGIVTGGTATGSTAGSGTSAAPWTSAGAVKANGIDTYELAFKVQTATGVAIADQVVDFTVEDTTVKLNKTSATTNAAGIVKVKATAGKAGTFYVKATAGSVSGKQYMTFVSSGVYELKMITADNQKVAKDTSFSFKVQMLDQSGNQINAAAAANATLINTNNSVQLKTLSKPTDANIDDDITASGSTSYTGAVTDEGYLKITIASTKINKEGDYTVKAYLNNGNSVDIKFNVKTQGTVNKLTVVYDQTTIPMNTAVGQPTVKRLDDAGYAKDVSGDASIKFTVSDVRRLAGTIAANGSFTSTTDKNYTGEFVVTAIDTEKNLTATANLTVAHQTNGFTLTPPANLEVGKDSTVVLQFVDVDGLPVSLSDSTATALDYNIMSKPSGAVVTTTSATSITADVKKTGKSNITVNCDKAGELKITVIATVTTGTSAGTYATTMTLNVGATKTVIGAKKINMFIASKGYVQDGVDMVEEYVAPYIAEGNRTMVAIAPIATGFGAEKAWNEVTRTVTLTRSDMTLTLVIGSSTITKVAGGVTSEIVIDVPAAIKDGRTVIPLRAVAEAFGATVDYNPVTQGITITQ